MAADHQISAMLRLVGTVVAALALVATLLAPPGRAQSAGGECAVPMPLDEVTVGMTGSGLTVTRGTTPESFGAEVLGVLNDGIAPGIDLIIADLSSPAVEAAGVWAGMSGSPVYAEDGRLIGAVSYSLAADPSSIAGLTPAAQMTKLYDFPGSTRALTMDQHVPLPAAVRNRALAASAATAGALRQGMAPIPVPVGVSGLRTARLSALEKRLEGRLDLALHRASRGSPETASPSEIFAGSNFAAALSYGDLTAAGIGTTTDVCDGMALAFGHPFLWDGRTSLSAHTADAILVQPDSGFGISYKLANPGGVVGTVDQDRLTGVRAALGAGPDPTVAWSRVTSASTGERRTGRTWINRDKEVPEIAPFHLLVNLDRILDKIGDGRVQLTWKVTGTRGDGTDWKLTRKNRFADRFDVTFESIFEMLDWLFILQDNTFTNVAFDRVTMTSTVREDFQRLRLGTVRLAVNNGRYRRVSSISRLRVRPGDTIRARVPLRKFREQDAFRTINLKMVVPRRLSGQSMTLGVFGGLSLANETNPQGGRSFNDILSRMRRQESNNDVVMRLQRNGGSAGPMVLKKKERVLSNVVSGRRTVRVTVR